jgi:hypothetical protein
MSLGYKSQNRITSGRSNVSGLVADIMRMFEWSGHVIQTNQTTATYKFFESNRKEEVRRPNLRCLGRKANSCEAQRIIDQEIKYHQ